jgi:competence protein ComEC
MRRSGQPVNTLSLAAMILMAINPQLLFNVGVQLSFLAVVTLLTCQGPKRNGSAALQEVFRREEQLQTLLDSSRSPTERVVITGYRWLVQAIWFSCCVSAITAPLVWQHFHVVSPISVVTNVILSPLLFIALASGVMTVLVGFLCEPCAIAPAAICGWAMEVIQRIVETAASIPGGHLWLPAPPSGWVAIYYGVITATMWWTKTRRTSIVRYGWILLWMILAWSMATRQPPLPAGQMEAIFVDVGHGTCVVLRLDDDKVWLYDCGRLGNESYSSRGIDSVLWSLGVTRLEGVFLSHADADHFNALPGVLRRFDVREVLVPVGLFNDLAPGLKVVHDLIVRRGLPIVELSSGARVRTGRQILRLLHPPSIGIGGSDNANSLVLRIDRGGHSLVLPGDLESPGTEWLIESDRPRPGGVLMAPHHGSLSEDTTAVLHWSRPAEVIVSGGRRAERPEVEAMLSQTGSSVHITSHAGSIRVRLNTSGQIRLQSWKESPW